jgi:peptidoglycan/xylan/chitin deacetylase (PgdA/CDA1 family)
MRSPPPVAPGCIDAALSLLRADPEASLTEHEAADSTARAALRLIYAYGGLARLHHLWPRRLTVLAYHRVIDDRAAGFDGLVDNVSATPESFAAQLELLRRWFRVISLEDLLAWLGGGADLPERAALITFDDGYRDNFDHALPILRSYRLPAVLFLATGCVGNPRPFFWDLAAYCFRRTRRTQADLPLCGLRRWPDEGARVSALRSWLSEAKTRPANEYGDLSRALARSLAVEVPDDAFRNQHVSWRQVREMLRSGVAIAAHTHNHAILSRVPLHRAREEVVASKRCIEAMLGAPVSAFAYPNGLAQDYRREDVAMLRREGFAAGFTLVDGPTGRRAARRNPLEIRRILVTRNDDLASFAAKVSGFTRFIRLLGRSGGGPAPRGGAASSSALWH